ncbi:hypothetical protein PMZ80_002153 [Knufia obscura]|uniref:Uncharacterized protein n=1 Tax=Knufia obscura TaxID=1635080 RepID=A0ABR0RWI3_9EURO|nr:hypothetical protein PMZ80_002153 [Knufia obscura]
MPVSFSYSIIPGGIKRRKKPQVSILSSPASSKAPAPAQLEMYRPDRDRHNRPFTHFQGEHGCRCCPVHQSHNDFSSEEGETIRSEYSDHNLPHPAQAYKAFISGKAYFPSRLRSQHGGLYPDSPPPARARALRMNRQPYVAERGHAFYPDDIRGRRIKHIPSSPTMRSQSSGMDYAGSPGFDSPVPQSPPFHSHETVAVSPMAFKAAAEKLFSVLTKAEKFFDIFLQSFKHETAAAYMDRASEWKRKVTRYNRDLVLPTLKIDVDPNNTYLGNDEATQIHDRDTFDELQAQVQKHVQQLSRSHLGKPASSRHHSTYRPKSDHEHEFHLPDDASIKLEVQFEVAQALLKSVEAVQPELLRYVKRMNEDYNAAREALSIMKRLRRVLDQYRRGWQDEEKDLTEG